MVAASLARTLLLPLAAFRVRDNNGALAPFDRPPPEHDQDSNDEQHPACRGGAKCQKHGASDRWRTGLRSWLRLRWGRGRRRRNDDGGGDAGGDLRGRGRLHTHAEARRHGSGRLRRERIGRLQDRRGRCGVASTRRCVLRDGHDHADADAAGRHPQLEVARRLLAAEKVAQRGGERCPLGLEGGNVAREGEAKLHDSRGHCDEGLAFGER